MASLIPTNNGKALAAYYCGIFSLIPCLGLALGPAAFVLGLLGLKAHSANPAVEGRGHSLVGVILGGITGVVNIGIALFMMVGMFASR
jgi:hypothetical protein